MKLPRTALEWLIFGETGERRYTQDSPVLPDVWIAYGLDPGHPQQLLITPHRDARPGAVAVALRERLGLGREGARELGHGVAYTQSSVAARLTLGELVRVVLPMTEWWSRLLRQRKGARGKGEATGAEEGAAPPAGEGMAAWLREAIAARKLGERLAEGVARVEASADVGRGHRLFPLRGIRDTGAKLPEPPSAPLEVVWMARIIGWLAWAAGRPEAEAPPPSADAFTEWRKESDDAPTPADLVAALLDLLQGDREDLAPEQALPPPLADPEARVWLINRNRSAHLAIRDSRLATKADAAWRLFDISCDGLAWAVIDSGIDATHPAFRKTDPATGEPFKDEEALLPEPGRGRNNTRIARTFDFSRVRLLLNPAVLMGLTGSPETTGELPEAARDAIESLVGPEELWPSSAERGRQVDVLRQHLEDLRALVSREDALAELLADQLEDLQKRLLAGRDVDWALLEPFLEVHPAQYWIPASDHGTHVAGILAGDWEADGVRYQGMCPDLVLYDFRVLPTGRPGPEDEFNVIAALQFLRHLNRQKDHFVIHGANLSLSIPHEVANYACGRTPVCDEASRVVAAGVVVVAAAGNNGYLRYQTAQGEHEGYHTISITDPGNAEEVVTVGATHRNRPHTYGVSYFSSRGPTGDGRLKPDLVAPGEKISAPVLGGEVREKDGTSMAAPHVSGAAAILLARHRELIGQPGRIKQLLCSSATDLGREHYFQGHGMLDVLRALQAV